MAQAVAFKENPGFKPGQSGNPLGPHKKESVAQLCRKLVPKVIKRLEHWLDQDKVPSASIEAGKILLDRAYGKPVQPIADGSNHEALELDLNGLSVAQLERLEATFSKLIPRMRQIHEAPLDLPATDVSQPESNATAT